MLAYVSSLVFFYAFSTILKKPAGFCQKGTLESWSGGVCGYSFVETFFRIVSVPFILGP
jgi:hypothetical protein